jgi:hypothetical protein
MSASQKQRATRNASGDWEYCGFVISQCYRTKRWVAIKDDSLHGTEVFWSHTLRAAKSRVDDLLRSSERESLVDCHDQHLCRHNIDS